MVLARDTHRETVVGEARVYCVMVTECCLDVKLLCSSQDRMIDMAH